MKINPEKFDEYMNAKNALNKIADCATFGEPVALTPQECRALFAQKVIDLEVNRGMME